MRIGLFVALFLVVGLATCSAQTGGAGQDPAVIDLLRPYFDDGFTPADGPDSDKAFIREYTRRIGEGLPDKLAVKPAKRRRVLVVTQQTMGFLHVPAAAGLLTLLRKSAEKHRGFELTEVTTDKGITREMLAGFDAVVINNQGLPADPKFHRELLTEYVRNGGGFFAVHAAALADSTSAHSVNSEYNRMLGAYVDRTAKYGHPANPFVVFPTTLPDPKHPLARAFRGPRKDYVLTYQELRAELNRRRKYTVKLTAPGQLSDELYVLVREPDPANKPTVVVEIDAANSGADYPERVVHDLSYAIAWIKPYGKGRVYYTQLGHNMAVYSIHAVAQAMLDGLQYATGDLKVVDR